MRKNLFLSVLTAMLVIGLTTAQAIKVHTIGDSTMAQYDPNSTVTRGWGMYLQQFLNGITVNNRGKGGASTRSFYQGSQYWASVKSQMTAGDYVLIQFAHNDEKNQGMDGDSLKAYYKRTGQTELADKTDNQELSPRAVISSTLLNMSMRHVLQDALRYSSALFAVSISMGIPFSATDVMTSATASRSLPPTVC